MKVDDLKVYYKTNYGMLKAVDGVSFSLDKSEIIGLVGESGCGKTTVGLSVMGLLPPGARILGGEIRLADQDLLKKTEEEMRRVRCKRVSMIFQGALNSLNPVISVKRQIAEAILAHESVAEDALEERINSLFRSVGVDVSRKGNYPHEFSGGMKQRVMIAMALACNPEVVVADEPTTALDVIVQYQILELMRSLRDKLQLSMILITHDLSVVAEICDRVIIMYAGRIAELGDILDVFENPKHPYTRALLRSIPTMHSRKRELLSIPGSVPDLTGDVPACRFYGRCPYGKDLCQNVDPQTEDAEADHSVACHFWRQIEK